MIADITVPWPTTGNWLLGLVGALSVTFLVLGTISQWKKVFGRKPPMDEQLTHLDKSLRKDMRAGDYALEEQIKSLRGDVNVRFEEMTEARQDHSSEVKRSFGEIAKKLDDQTVELTASAERRTEATNEKILDLHKICARLDERTKKL